MSSRDAQVQLSVRDRPGWMHYRQRMLTGRGVTVALVDSGWQRSASDHRVRRGAGFVDDAGRATSPASDDDDDRIGHGTACGRCLLEVAPDASLLPLRVFGRRLGTTPAVIVEAIEWALTRGVPIINLSLDTTREEAAPLLYMACERARRAGALVVAAGNLEFTSYPGAFDNVLSVGLGRFKSPFEFTYREEELVECLAAGQLRRSPSDSFVVSTGGASFATARIAGIVALMRERWPDIALDGIRRKLAQYSVAHG
jgi:subtilisin